jgi:hypothetical protein
MRSCFWRLARIGNGTRFDGPVGETPEGGLSAQRIPCPCRKRRWQRKNVGAVGKFIGD